MDKILPTDSMSSVAGKINLAFNSLDSGETFEEVLPTDSMSSVAGKCSNNFALLTDDASIQQIVSGDSMSAIADKLEYDFEVAGESSIPNSKFSFLHISDPHGETDGINMFRNMLSGYIDGYANCKFGVITGDLKATGASSMSYTSGTFAGDAAGKLLLVAGNHDSYDSWDGNQSNKVSRHMTDWMYDVMGDDVNWGDTNGTDNEPLLSSYWYKDFNVDSDYPVRVISLDQYEIDKAYGTDRYKDFTNGFWYNPVYSAAQMNWLINLLLNTPSNYNIIVLCHQSPYTDNEYFTQSLKVTSENDSYNNVPYSKLFISEKCGNAPFTESGYYNYNNFLLKIIRAYLNSSTYSENLLIGKMTPGTEDLRITINADFTNTTPARFWGWYYGHLHLDLVCWAPYEQFKEGETKELFPNQLMVGVTCVNKRTGGNCDLVKDIVYRINKYTLDFEKGELLIERIGQQLTTGGRTRDRLLFNMGDMSISHPIN